MVRLEDDSHRGIQVTQMLDNIQTVHGISGNSGDGLRDDVVHFPCIAIPQKSLQGLPVFDLCATDSFIRIDTNQLPPRLCFHIFGVMVLLQFKGRFLLVIVCRETYICSNPFFSSICYGLWWFCRNDGKL